MDATTTRLTDNGNGTKAIIGVDLAKQRFEMAILDAPGQRPPR